MAIAATQTDDFKSAASWRAALAEFFVVLLFCFFGPAAVVVTGAMTGGAMTSARLVAIALAHGLSIFLLATASGPVSGGHVNSAVTISMLVAGQMSAKKAAMYIVAQLIGAAVGSFLLLLVVPGGASTGLGAHALGPGMTLGAGMLAEIIGTFLLVGVIFMTAVHPRGMGTVATLAIGSAVLVIHLAFVPLTGASVNPSRSFGPWLWTQNIDVASFLLLYWVAPIIGGVIAAVVAKYVFINPEQ